MDRDRVVAGAKQEVDDLDRAPRGVALDLAGRGVEADGRIGDPAGCGGRLAEGGLDREGEVAGELEPGDPRARELTGEFCLAAVGEHVEDVDLLGLRRLRRDVEERLVRLTGQEEGLAQRARHPDLAALDAERTAQIRQPVRALPEGLQPLAAEREHEPGVGDDLDLDREPPVGGVELDDGRPARDRHRVGERGRGRVLRRQHEPVQQPVNAAPDEVDLEDPGLAGDRDQLALEEAVVEPAALVGACESARRRVVDHVVAEEAMTGRADRLEGDASANLHVGLPVAHHRDRDGRHRGARETQRVAVARSRAGNGVAYLDEGGARRRRHDHVRGLVVQDAHVDAFRCRFRVVGIGGHEHRQLDDRVLRILRIEVVVRGDSDRDRLIPVGIVEGHQVPPFACVEDAGVRGDRDAPDDRQLHQHEGSGHRCTRE